MTAIRHRMAHGAPDCAKIRLTFRSFFPLCSCLQTKKLLWLDCRSRFFYKLRPLRCRGQKSSKSFGGTSSASAIRKSILSEMGLYILLSMVPIARAHQFSQLFLRIVVSFTIVRDFQSQHSELMLKLLQNTTSFLILFYPFEHKFSIFRKQVYIFI